MSPFSRQTLDEQVAPLMEWHPEIWAEFQALPSLAALDECQARLMAHGASPRSIVRALRAYREYQLLDEDPTLMVEPVATSAS